ncbi:MAG: glutamine--fructose-6-phosphate transaminase (isomerizing) [bacterium]
MCGISAYVGNRKCREFILEGLARLEYRGYDSAGIVFIDSKHKHFSYHKEAGGVDIVKRLGENAPFDGYIGMGHTRWATHGIVDTKNAHPHFNCNKSIAVVHNGIIEECEKIREELLADKHVFESSTDTEVIVHLFGCLLKTQPSLKQAILTLVQRLRGAYALVFIMEKYPDQLIVIRRRSPLVVGVGQDEKFVASDFLAFSDKVSDVLFLPDSSFAIIKRESIELFDFDGNPMDIAFEKIDTQYESIDRSGFEHYMLKEIYEQKKAITRSINFCKIIGDSGKNQSSLGGDGLWRQMGLTSKQVKNLTHIGFVAAGTSWHAARVAQFFFEYICKIPVRVHLASEFLHMPFFPGENGVYVAISQSGETADTLQAMRLVNSYNISTIALTNVASSTIVREAAGFLPMQAGPEISVASTKAFSTQLAMLYWLAHRIALQKGLVSISEMREAEEDLFVTAEILETTIETYKLKITQELAEKYSKFDRYIFLGRHISYPLALEAALKVKEIAYIFAECYPAGELKHGPIALVDQLTPVVIFSTLDDVVYWKIVSNAEEVRARKGHLLVFAFEGQKELIKLADYAFIIPRVKPLLGPLAMTGLVQFFVYHITKKLNHPVDRPRNLAKSVTVE